MAKEIEQIVCEYRTMFEDVASTVPNIRPNDDVLYSSVDYGKILQSMCQFLEGYMEYRDANDDKYDDKVITSTCNFYNAMFADTSDQSPYRHQVTLADMQRVNESFISGTQQLKVVLESMMEHHPDFETTQLVTMTQNQYRKLAKVYRDDAELYMWLATKNSRTRPKNASLANRVNFGDISTPVIHRLDQYQKSNKGV